MKALAIENNKIYHMKRMLSPLAAVFSLILLASFSNTASAQPRAGVSINYQTFYDELDPYGRWIDYPDHGYVWIPDAGPDFRPYSTNGHWVWSDDYEWMWVSDYNWGWAPFHYGRWLLDPYYGWIWVPGYEWSPAWVAWRDGGDYYGWAPLRPGINISINFSLGGYNPPIDYWCFTPRRYITSHRLYDYCVPRRNNVTIINNTTIINNYNYQRNVFRTGPNRRDAERYAGRINSVRFRESSNPGRTRFSNNEVSFYRPNVNRDNGRQYTPRRVEQFQGNGNRGDNNNGAITRRNGNNLPERRQQQGNENRRFERRNNNENQPGNQNGDLGRRRDIIQRDNPRTERPNRSIERPNNQNREARPFERRNTQTQPGRNNERQMERREVFGRGNEQRGNNNNEIRQRRNNNVERAPQNNQQRPERRDVMRRNDNGGRQEMGNGNRPSRQPERRNEGGGGNRRERR